MVLLFSLFLLWDFFEGRPTINLIRIRPVPWNLLFMLLMGFWLLRLSMSKTSLMSLTVSAVLLLRGKKLMSRKISRAVLTAALALPILVFFSQQFSDVIAPLLGALGRDTTFTGRTEIWSHITLSTVNPLIGSGYWNFWGGPGGLAFNESLHEVIPNAHNGYIDIYLDGGFIGLALLLFFLVANGGRFAKRIGNSADSDRYQRMKFAVLIAAIIFNLSESVFARMDPLWFTTLLMIYEFPMKAAVKELQPDSTRLKEEDYFPIPEALSGARLGGP